jgi:hypothetical protein
MLLHTILLKDSLVSILKSPNQYIYQSGYFQIFESAHHAFFSSFLLANASMSIPPLMRVGRRA